MRRYLRGFSIGSAVALALLTAILVNTGIIVPLAQGFSFLNATFLNHVLTAIQNPGLQPTAVSGTVTIASTDFSGQVQCTSATACALTWSTAYKVAPFCVVTDNTTFEGVRSTSSTTGMTIVGNAVNDFLSWVCVGTATN